MALEESMPTLPTSFEVVTELSDDALLTALQNYGVDMGKFVRFGPLIMIGPSTPIQETGTYPYHRDIAKAAYYHTDQDLRTRVREAADLADNSKNIGENYPGIMDAGHYLCEFVGVREVALVAFFGFSTGFRESVHLRGRHETAYLARAALSETVTVQAV